MDIQGVSRGRGRNPNRAPTTLKPSPFQEYEVYTAKTPTGSPPPPLSSYILPTNESPQLSQYVLPENTLKDIYAFQDIVPFQKSPEANKPKTPMTDANNNNINANNNNNIKTPNLYANKFNYNTNVQTNDNNASNFNANVNNFNNNNNRFKYNKQTSFTKKLPSTWGTLGTTHSPDDDDDDSCPTCDRSDKTVFCTTCGHSWKVCCLGFKRIKDHL